MNPTLLISIGTSPLLLIEALEYPDVHFKRVHVITTDQAQLEWQSVSDLYDQWKGITDYIKAEYNVRITWSVIDGLSVIATAEDHKIWQETILRWAASFYDKSDMYYCLSGGTKTMPASFHYAARLFGAENVFHVLIPQGRKPSSIYDVEELIQAEELSYVKLGSEEGLSSLLDYSRQFKLQVMSEIRETFTILKPPHEYDVSEYSRNVLDTIESHISNMGNSMPFQSMILLPQIAKSWLEEPLNRSDKEWIQALPKVDLHTHLGGFATKGTLLNQVRAAADNPDKLKEIDFTHYPDDARWPRPDESIALQDYMKAGDNTGSTILHDMGCLRRHCELMYEHFLSQNLIYAEVRCSPNNYARKTDKSAWEVLKLIEKTFTRMMKENEYKCIVKLLIIATRKRRGDLSDISKHLSLAITAYYNSQDTILDTSLQCSVVGVDLAGYEFKETRAIYFQHDFNSIHRAGIAVTAHAGENDDAEGIWQAVYKLHSRRIGHGLRLLEAPDLLRTFVERQIGIEMCPYANFQIAGFYPMEKYKAKRYPLLQYLEKGLKVNINTDNIGISDADITDNFLLLIDLCPGIKRIQILKLILNGIEMAFAARDIKLKMLNRANQEIRNLIMQYGT